MKNDYTKITSAEELREEILNLRIRSERQKERIHESVKDLKVSIKPMNLLRQAAETIRNSGRNNELVQSLMGLGGGAIAKNVLFGKPKGLLNRIWTAGAEMILTRVISKQVLRKSKRTQPALKAFSAPTRPVEKLRPVFDEPGQGFSPSLRSTSTPWIADTMELPAGNLMHGRYDDQTYQMASRQVF